MKVSRPDERRIIAEHRLGTALAIKRGTGIVVVDRTDQFDAIDRNVGGHQRHAGRRRGDGRLCRADLRLMAVHRDAVHRRVAGLKHVDRGEIAERAFDGRKPGLQCVGVKVGVKIDKRADGIRRALRDHHPVDRDGMARGLQRRDGVAQRGKRALPQPARRCRMPVLGRIDAVAGRQRGAAVSGIHHKLVDAGFAPHDFGKWDHRLIAAAEEHALDDDTRVEFQKLLLFGQPAGTGPRQK